MAKSVYREITGLDTLSGVLRGLPVDMRASILVNAVSAAAEPIKVSAKRHARRSVRTGALYASIEKKVVKSKGLENASATAMVGPSRDYFGRGGRKVEKGGDRRAAEQPSRYAHLVEFGHAVKARGKSGSKPGKGKAREPKEGALRWVPPRPFMRPAMMENQGRVPRILLEEIEHGIEKTRRKLVREGAHVA